MIILQTPAASGTPQFASVGLGTAPGANGLLTFASSTAATGGLAFGADTQLYRSAAGTLTLRNTSAFSAGGLFVSGTVLTLDSSTNTDNYINSTSSSNAALVGFHSNANGGVVGAIDVGSAGSLWAGTYGIITAGDAFIRSTHASANLAIMAKANAIKLGIDTALVASVTSTGLTLASGMTLTLGVAAAVGAAVVSTHKLAVKDSTGTTYYLLASDV